MRKRCFGLGCVLVSWVVGVSRSNFPSALRWWDFACRSAKLVVELDGGQHAVAPDDDAERTRLIEAHGYRVIRYWNNEVMQNLDGVLEDILKHLRIASNE
jgi:very-short-patch-repair endonuclease